MAPTIIRSHLQCQNVLEYMLQDACNACRYSWPEACAQLDLAVEDSRKQKRRGTPNAIVLAGMSMPTPFETPVQMPKSHVRMLHQLRQNVRARAGLPPLSVEVKEEGGAE